MVSTEQIKLDSSLYRLDKLKEISLGNDAFVKEMVAIFVADATHTGESFQLALNRKDMKTIKSLAHKIKPTLETFEIPFYTEIRRIELLTQFEGTNDDLQKLISKFQVLISQVIGQLKINGECY